MKLREAASRGISRVYLEEWAEPNCYLKIDILPDGSRGPWLHLFSPQAQKSIGAPTPQDFIEFGDPYDDFLEYVGPLADEDKPSA